MSKFSFPKKKGSPQILPEVDAASLEAFVAGARDRSLDLPAERPWSRFDPKERPGHNVSIRLNGYHLEMLRYLAGEMDVSQQKILRKHLIPIMERLAESRFNESQGKSG